MSTGKVTVNDIMTRTVVSVRPETPIAEAAKALQEHQLDGVPVVDEENILVGILTEYDLVSKGTLVHLPTFQKVLQNLSFEDRKPIQEIKEVMKLTVRDVMNTEPLTLSPDQTMSDAVTLFHEHHRVNPVPVINEDRKVVGVLSRWDIVKLFHLLYE